MLLHPAVVVSSQGGCCWGDERAAPSGLAGARWRLAFVPVYVYTCLCVCVCAVASGFCSHLRRSGHSWPSDWLASAPLLRSLDVCPTLSTLGSASTPATERLGAPAGCDRLRDPPPPPPYSTFLRAERRRNFPTATNIRKRQELAEQSKERGEIDLAEVLGEHLSDTVDQALPRKLRVRCWRVPPTSGDQDARKGLPLQAGVRNKNDEQDMVITSIIRMRLPSSALDVEMVPRSSCA